MCLFSAGHFNFRFEDEQQIDLLMPRQDARFLKWRLRVEGICVQDRRVILLTFLKDLPYRVVLIPCADILQGSKAQNEIKEQIAAEEYHLLTPDDAIGAKCISIFDIESFRRLQQIFLRAMIYADQAREDCPFCGNGMTVLYKNEKETCACPVCRTQIKTLRCEESGKEYFATDIGNFSPAVSADAQHRGSDPYLFGRLAESMLHFRNVTDIDQEGRPLCPFCGVKHF